MLCRWRSAVVLALSVGLASCASPYFVHDPQTFIINRDEVPRLLKALRCEMMTYVAADNQRQMLFRYVASVEKDVARAINDYPYFELDPMGYGGLGLDLKLQDSAGVNTGTNLNWKRSIRSWNFIPTASDQSSYEALWNFAIPQDLIALDTVKTHDDPDFQCFTRIPARENLPPFKNSKDRAYVAQDMDGLARGKYDEGNALFTRVRVNEGLPLAGWLLDVGTEIGRKTLFSLDPKQLDHMPPGQMTYTFTIVVTAGLDVKYSLTSTMLWDVLSADANISAQQTSTITIILNGLESATVVSAKSGTSKNVTALPLPVLGQVVRGAAAPSEPQRGYLGRTLPRGAPTYAPAVIPWGGATQ